MDTSSLFKQRDSRPITYQEAHDELLGAYDQAVGHDTRENNVHLSDFENPVHNSLYSIWYDTYLREQVGEKFHMSIDEFLDRPRYQIQMMLNSLARLRTAVKRDINKENALVDELERNMKGK